MSLNYKSIGKHIREIRQRNNLSQAMLSELVDKTPSYISYIESGIKSMSLDTFVLIANALEVSPDRLLMEQLTCSERCASEEITLLLSDCTTYEMLMINSCEVYLENVVLDESALVGKKGRGFFQLMKNFEVERLMSTAMNVGMAQAAYEEAARYATERVQFGKTIGSFQLTQEKIINMAIKIENMRNMVYHYAWMKQNGMSIATESAMRALRICLQMSMFTPCSV